jgi:hypothetical protein
VFNRLETGNFMGMQHFDAAAATAPKSDNSAAGFFGRSSRHKS